MAEVAGVDFDDLREGYCLCWTGMSNLYKREKVKSWN